MMYVVNKHVRGEVRAFPLPESMVEDDLHHYEAERDFWGLKAHIKRTKKFIRVLRENESFFYFWDKPSWREKVMELISESC